MRRSRPRLATLQRAADEFNARHPVGTRVRYWPGTKDGRCLEGVTRAEAQVLGGHTPVVWIEGFASSIALTHVEVVEEAASHG